MNRKKFEDQTKELFRSWAEIFRGRSLGDDFLAGLTVAAVALPLNIALAVASGLPPIAGLIAGAIGGAVAIVFGGTTLQVTGPAAALNVMVLAIYKDFGVTGVAAACFFIGFTQILLSALAAGRFIKFVPEAVLAGFTTGVGIKLLDNQIPELLGFDYTVAQLAEMMYRPEWLHEVSWLAVVCGLFVALIVTSCKQFKRFPAAIIAVAVVTAVSIKLNWDIKRVGLISSVLPLPSFPSLPDSQWLGLFLAALPLAILASVESLLSAKALDRMVHTSKPHNSNLELFGQGVANLASGLFSGMPVSGVIVRSSLNVLSGGKTRLAALVHAAVLLIAILYLSDLMASIPLSALAGLLIVVGLRLIEVDTFLELIKHRRVEAAAFVLAAVGTISGHLLLGLGSGIILHILTGGLKGSDLAERSGAALVRKAVRGHAAPRVIRGVVARNSTRGRPIHYEPAATGQDWLTQIRERAHLAASAFVHKNASVIGRVVLGEHVHIAAESSVRADEGSPFFIGSNSNIQDGVVIHALKERWVNVGGEDWAVYIGEGVSVAHQALVHGPCFIGDNTFVGFQAVVHDSIVGPRCYIGIGARVIGVEIPEGRYISHGMIVDTLDKAECLPLVTDAHTEFNEDVVEVNRGLAAAYRKQRSHPKLTKFNMKSLATTDRF
jgi:SulP family sulfate permease